ncbi:putative bifunctional diguanylate cyclase/phosphodiesterase [Shewanella sp. YIC-542]|uniref:putative bifunctional diguanylate cyclase/phosphodiesterase n=1 Tax=Shewanella mytili TaxID=3377111 RepID=UPI00398F573D
MAPADALGMQMIVGLAGLLAISVLVGLVLWWRYRRLQRFVGQLAEALRFASEHPKPLALSRVPSKAEPLYLVTKSLLQRLPANAGKDPLTGLQDRQWFKRVMTPLMPVTRGTLVLLDIERLRLVNDLFGFNVGDILLRSYAGRLSQGTPTPRFVARLDGDEFLLFYEQALTLPNLEALQQQLQQPYNIGSTPIGIRVKMGYLPLAQHHADMSLMLKRVDLALKKARNKQNSIAVYEAGDDQLHLREMNIIHSLPKALRHDQLYVVYQPKETLQNGSCEQVEALIRWEHPQLGQIAPSEFIPLAERAGMISLVSQWMVDNVLQQQQRWRKQGLDLRVAVNLGSNDFEQDVVACISQKLAQYQLPGSVLALEITEGVLLANLGSTREKLQQLQHLGLEIAIDDFGTGHSSLAYLKDLPVDELKIDKSFVDDLLTDGKARRIVLTTIEMAHYLGYRVTVEGVEDAQQRHVLQQMGADVLQGNLFSRPLRGAELAFHREGLRLQQQAVAPLAVVAQ